MTDTLIHATMLRLRCSTTGLEHGCKPPHDYRDLPWTRVSQFVGFDVFVDFADGSSQPLVTVRNDGSNGAMIYIVPGVGRFIPARLIIRNVLECIRELLESRSLTKQIVMIGRSGIMACYSPATIRVTGGAEGDEHGNP